MSQVPEYIFISHNISESIQGFLYLISILGKLSMEPKTLFKYYRTIITIYVPGSKLQALWLNNIFISIIMT
jgi:hypothetical protein